MKEQNLTDNGLRLDLSKIINKHNVDSIVGMPDFILAEYLFNTLLNLKLAQRKTADWKGEKCP